MDSHFKNVSAFSVYKVIAVFTALTFILLSLASCKGEPKTTYELLIDDEPDNALALIVNNPKEDVISKVEINKSVTLTDDGERFLVIPKIKNSVVEIYTVKEKNGVYVEDERVYLNESVNENFVLDVYSRRSKEKPAFELVIRTRDRFAKYVLGAVSGQQGEESFEFVKANNVHYSKSTPFTVDEISFYLYRNGSYLKKIYGQPTNEVTFERSNGSTATRMFFGNTVFEISNIDNKIYHAIMLDDKLPHLRDVKIGDSLPMVLVNFPNENDGYTAVYNGNDEAEGSLGQKEGASYIYQLLYGTFGVGQYGYIKYDSREVVTEVIYVDNGSSVIFAFKNNRVLSVEYRFEA